MLLLLAAIVNQKIELQNRTFCAPGTEKSVFSGIEICEPISCSSMSIDVCPADSCTAGTETQVSKCVTCLSANYAPQAGYFGICAYKCLRNSTMHDCFHLLGIDYCSGSVSVHNADTNTTDVMETICQVCASGLRPSADGLNCEDAGIPAERQVAGCLQYSIPGEGQDAEAAICVDCGIAHCERCENAPAQASVCRQAQACMQTYTGTQTQSGTQTSTSAQAPVCTQCTQGYSPLFGQCAQATAGCAQYQAGTLRCVRCLAGYVLFDSIYGVPACAPAAAECGEPLLDNYQCMAVVDAIGQVSHKLISLGIFSGETACDCIALPPPSECAAACGFCAPGEVFMASGEAPMASLKAPTVLTMQCAKADAITPQFCVRTSGMRCAECAAGFQLFDDAHVCLRRLQRCPANYTLSAGVACICVARLQRSGVSENECMLRGDACGEHGEMINNSCACSRGFAGRFCELCAGRRVLWRGACRSYRALEAMWWAFFALIVLVFIASATVLAARGWFSGVFRAGGGAGWWGYRGYTGYKGKWGYRGQKGEWDDSTGWSEKGESAKNAKSTKDAKSSKAQRKSDLQVIF